MGAKALALPRMLGGRLSLPLSSSFSCGILLLLLCRETRCEGSWWVAGPRLVSSCGWSCFFWSDLVFRRRFPAESVIPVSACACRALVLKARPFCRNLTKSSFSFWGPHLGASLCTRIAVYLQCGMTAKSKTKDQMTSEAGGSHC